MWNFSCRKTRRLLALSAGGDFEGLESPGTRRHLTVCPRCREVWQGLERSQRALQRLNGEPATRLPVSAGDSASSIWPGIQRNLKVIDDEAAAPDWRGWLPAGALAAACLAIVMVSLPEAPLGTNTAGNLPSVIHPQTVGTVPHGAGRDRVWVREMPDLGQELLPQPLDRHDEQRSF